MKKQLAYSLFWIFVLVTWSPVLAHNKDDTKLTKTITREYHIPPDGHVTIVNKYGPVVINTWDKDSVHITIEVTAFGKNDKSVNKIMDRVDFDFSQKNQYLTMATVLDRSSGFFTELWNNIGDYSKTLLSQNQLKIEYTIYLPSTNDLDITNKFGDVYLEDFIGEVEIEMSHGNLRAGKMVSSLDLDLSFGNFDVKSIHDADLRLKATEAEIQFIRKGRIQSSSSEISISEIEDLRIDSKSDRRIHIKEGGSISGTGSFSKIRIENFKEELNLSLNYGTLDVTNLQPGFSRIDIKGKTTEITLDFQQGNYLNFEYIGNENKLFVSRGEENLSKQYVAGSDKKARMNGFLGIRNQNPAKVVVETESGEVNVKID